MVSINVAWRCGFAIDIVTGACLFYSPETYNMIEVLDDQVKLEDLPRDDAEVIICCQN